MSLREQNIDLDHVIICFSRFGRGASHFGWIVLVIVVLLIVIIVWARRNRRRQSLFRRKQVFSYFEIVCF